MPRNAGKALTQSREVTPQHDAELASVFKADLTNIKSLVTCTICDQLLYEPWTLGCGHTYCYSCLCNWFVPNKRKKTCPDCRTPVQHIPAPAYLVKQMVEIFTKRSELMPSDESAEQHDTKRAEEIAEVEKDRKSDEGLFKGVFPKHSTKLILDEGDGIYRCPSCLTEHEGGPTCGNCGQELDGFDFSDDDDFGDDIDDGYDLESLELDMDMDDVHIHHPAYGMAHFRHIHIPGRFHHPMHHHYHIDESEDSGEYDSEDLDGDSDEAGSLQGFVVNDEDEQGDLPNPAHNLDHQEPVVSIAISDESESESDEGGIVSRRRNRHFAHVIRDSSPSEQSVVTVSSSAASDDNDQARLRHAGWSPLPQGDGGEVAEMYYGYPPSYNASEGGDDEESDTETMVGHGASDDGLQARGDLSETPRYESETPTPEYDVHDDYGYDCSPPTEEEDSDVEVVGYARRTMDEDGDTDMSTTGASRTSRSESVDSEAPTPYGIRQSESRSVSVDTPQIGYGVADYSEMTQNSSDDEGTGMGEEELGRVNQIHEAEDDSSDDSPIRPPQRRRREARHNMLQQYDRTQVFDDFRQRHQMPEAQGSSEAEAPRQPRQTALSRRGRTRASPEVAPPRRSRQYARRVRLDPSRRDSRSPAPAHQGRH